jgi:hypothetical protein
MVAKRAPRDDRSLPSAAGGGSFVDGPVHDDDPDVETKPRRALPTPAERNKKPPSRF